jgi:hypothetical protein
MKTMELRDLILVAHRPEGSAARLATLPPMVHAAVGRSSLCGRKLRPEHGWERVAGHDPRRVTCGRCRKLL